MSITLHQRVAGYVWHWRTGPGWLRNAIEMLPLRHAAGKGEGMRILKIQLQDDGLVPRDLVDEYRAIGFKVFGMFWPQGPPHGSGTWTPLEAAQYVKDERNRLALSGMDCNFEDAIRLRDQETGGQWSEEFCSRVRTLCPTLPFHFDSYFGAAAGGINLGAYKSRGFRPNIQSFWGSEGLWDDPSTNMVRWLGSASPPFAKATIKPIFRVAPNNSGQLPNWDVVFTDTKIAGTKGCGFYYIDAMDLDTLCDLVRRAIRSGIAY